MRKVLTILAMMTLLPPIGIGARRARSTTGTPTLSAGTVLHLRLQTAVSTKTSKTGGAIAAELAREADLRGETVLPYGTTFKGAIKTCSPPAASGDRAQLLLSFSQLTVPGEGDFALQGRLSGISNARENLLANGTVVGVLESETPASLLGGLLARLGQADSTINDEIQKQKIGQVNTAVELPAGADLEFTLTGPLVLKRFVPSAGPAPLSFATQALVESALADAPQRAASKDHHPGDPINLVFIGSAQEIEHAFREAGWIEPKRKTGQSIWKTTEAVINDDGYNAAPVSDLYVFGRRQDLAFEKTLDTFNKRHHLRLWKSAASTPDGRPIWLGAATHDIGIDIHLGVISHATDPDLDDEGAQVGSDLFLGGQVQAAGFVTPRAPLSSGWTATGGAWHTDGKLYVIDLKSSAAGPAI